MSKYIGRYVVVVYDADSGNYYLERREPGNWAISVLSWNTKQEAIEAINIEWEK